jgi:hypothetical protein
MGFLVLLIGAASVAIFVFAVVEMAERKASLPEWFLFLLCFPFSVLYVGFARFAEQRDVTSEEDDEEDDRTKDWINDRIDDEWIERGDNERDNHWREGV